MYSNFKKFLGLCIFTIAIIPQRSFALDYYLQPSAWFFMQSGDDVVFPKKYSTHLSINGGFIVNNSFAVTAKYTLDRDSTSLSGSTGSSQKFASLAAGVGYHQNKDSGIFIDALAYLFPTYTESYDNESTVYYGKYGMGVDISYLAKIGSISIGPIISIRKIEFSKIYADDTALELKTKPNFLQIKPYLSMVFAF